MRIFVAGATGVLGQRTVPMLVQAGHDVTAVARTPEKAAWLRSVGATTAAVDLFDAAAVAEAVAGHDVVANLATSSRQPPERPGSAPGPRTTASGPRRPPTWPTPPSPPGPAATSRSRSP